MKSQACEPCAKRKVRCDRVEPSCSNCKRRKNDHCVYPEISPLERIKLLEDKVRALGGDPSLDESEKSSNETTYRNGTTRTAETPVLLHEEGRSVYLESEGWQAWTNAARLHGGNRPEDSIAHRSIHCTAKQLPHALQGSPWKRPSAYAATSIESSAPGPYAIKLWSIFRQRVEPVTKICFEWTLQQFQAALADNEKWNRLSEGEHALIHAICLLGAVSLSKEECLRDFGQSRSSLLAEYRIQCENLFTRMNLLVIDDIVILKALCLYIIKHAGIDTLTINSLWSLMGLVCRSAEQLGIHRDGQLLGLPSADTEERRRLWWKLQHIELILAIKGGVTPMTFTAHWDCKLPLNIEDYDIADITSKTAPTERLGLTSQSYTLFVYWIINEQRAFRQERPNQQNSVDRSFLGPLADTMINELETGVNKKFLQYCDPIKPLDAFIQISARAVICVLRLRRLHMMRLLISEHLDDKSQDEYFNTCLQSLRYVTATYSQPSLKRFHWTGESSFPWHAFIGVLLDLSRLTDLTKTKVAWDVLADLYSATPFLMEFDDDKRKIHAARLVVATWDVCQRRADPGTSEEPAFICALEERIPPLGPDDTSADNVSKEHSHSEPPGSEIGQSQNDIGELNFDFADIDWSFWESIS